MKFFLRAVESRAVARRLLLRELAEFYRSTRERFEEASESGTILRAVDLVFERLILTARMVEEELQVSGPYSYRIIQRLEEYGLIQKSTRYTRPQMYISSSLFEFWDKA